MGNDRYGVITTSTTSVLCFCFLLGVWLVTCVCCENITIGYLASVTGTGKEMSRQGLKISGAITYAIDQINNSTEVLPNHTLRLEFFDTKGDMFLSTRTVIEMWTKRDVVAFIGPESSCYEEAVVATALNLPMISYKCADSMKPNMTFARTNPSEELVVSSVIQLLKNFNWKRFTILYEDSPSYETVALYLKKETEKHKDFEIHGITKFSNRYDCCEKKESCCNRKMGDVIDSTYRNTRIYVYFGYYLYLSEMLIEMRMRNLLGKGEYMVIMVDNNAQSNKDVSFNFFSKTSKQEEIALREACRNLLVIVPTVYEGKKEYIDFLKKVREYRKEEPFNFPTNDNFPYEVHVSVYAAYLYDAVWLYANATTDILNQNVTVTNGTAIINQIKKRRNYESVLGVGMKVDNKGDVEGNYTVLAFLPSNASLKGRLDQYDMLPVGLFKDNQEKGQDELVYQPIREIEWVGGHQPLDRPPCGFDESECQGISQLKEVVAWILGGTLLLVSIVTFLVYRNWKYEQEIDGLLWKLDPRELDHCKPVGDIARSQSRQSFHSTASKESLRYTQGDEIILFRNSYCKIKMLQFSRRSGDIPRETKKEMKIMRELHHDNITPFIGACIDGNKIHVITEYATKGSLQDVLENEYVKLDNMFIASFVFDLIRGLEYLHDSELKVHGNLKSCNCVITSRWVLQLTDYGLIELREAAAILESDENIFYKNLLWRSPEVLRNPADFPKGSQKDDIFAFGIILHEIMTRQGAWGKSAPEAKTIVKYVMKEPYGEPFRPPTDDLQLQNYVLDVMKSCWAEKPENRMEIRDIKNKLKQMRSKGMKANIMDNMIMMMEKYANNLEDLVRERTRLLELEQEKTRDLLHRMLPETVAQQLIKCGDVQAESCEAVTIYFSDIVGFTELSATSTPLQVVSLLDDLYRLFDNIINNYEVYKVETIGDAYMVVSGLPIRIEDRHAEEIASMALELLHYVKSFVIRHRPDAILKLRIGIHTGPVAAGVVGRKMPRYCLFGDTVNTASRMESNGEALKIHISDKCRDFLVKLGKFQLEERGIIKVKGKGEMKTYWLLGHIDGPMYRWNGTDISVSDQPIAVLNPGTTMQNKSPKDCPRRASVVPKIDASLGVSSLMMNGSVGGIQALHRRRQDSPNITKRSPSTSREFMRKKLDEGVESIESSYIDINSSSKKSPGLLPPPPIISRSDKARSMDCDSTNSDFGPRSTHRLWTEKGKNGLKSLDETVRPLLNDSEQDTSGCKSSNTLTVEEQAKRWRSCDEISNSGISRERLKKAFNGLLKFKLPSDGSNERSSVNKVGVDVVSCDDSHLSESAV